MKAISLLQPWATLVVIGAKKIETRSWGTRYEGPLLIHASKKMDADQKKILRSKPFWNAIKHLDELPLGKVIGMVTLKGVFSFDMPAISYAIENNKSVSIGGTDLHFTKQEKAFGDYSSGRTGFILDHPVSFEHHYPVRGSLSLWDFDEQICYKCGCSEFDACNDADYGPCWWVGPNLCSHCQMKQD